MTLKSSRTKITPNSANQRRKRGRGNGSGTLYKKGGTGPWYVSYYNDRGRRVTQCAGTTDKATAQAILNKRLADVAKRREGIIDHADALVIDASHKAIADHAADYLNDCERSGQATHHTNQKRKHLERLIAASGIAKLHDLTADVLSRHLRTIATKGRSARTQNAVRAAVVAFGNWCVKQGRLSVNPLLAVATADESRDRRRVRRALTDDELAKLLAVAGSKGRRAWYLAGVLAGLRKGDMQRLKWTDIDFDAGMIVVRGGKSGRDDVVPLHPDLASELLPMRGMPTAKVFPTTVMDRTRLGDFLAAGLAERVPVLDADGKPVMRIFGKGRSRHEVPVTKIVVLPDAQGRVVDLHAMRTTLGTNLARAGVSPQVSKEIMRHSDYKTTLKHYTALQVRDAAAAIGQIRLADAAPAKRAVSGSVAVEVAVDMRSTATTREIVRDKLGERANRLRSSTNANRPLGAGDCDSVQVVTSERVKGFEPSTFSLEG